MQLSRDEFWVLDLTARLGCHFDLFHVNSPDAKFHANKRRNLDLSSEDAAELIVRMQKQGDLAVYRNRPDLFSEFDILQIHPPRAPGIRIVCDVTPIWENPVFFSKSEILADFRIADEIRKRNEGREFPDRERCPDDMLCFCATKQGATRWEETAQVDWNKFLDCSGNLRWSDTDLAENQGLALGRVGAVSKKTLDAYFDWKTRWASYLYSHETCSFRRFHTDRIAPWRATYWKTFPEGFECDYLELITYRHQGWNKAEYEIERRLGANYWPEHHALFDWHNAYVPDFPFEGE